MKKSLSKKDNIKSELANIIRSNSIQNKLLQKYIDKLENLSSSASKESQHSKLYDKDSDSQ